MTSLAFLIEGRDSDELPERIIAGTDIIAWRFDRALDFQTYISSTLCESKDDDDDDDDEKKTEENEIELFHQASEHVRKSGGKNLTNQNKIDFYGLFKQATKGSNTTSRPSGMFDPVGAAKWDGWTKYKSWTKESAMSEYIKLTRRFASSPSQSKHSNSHNSKPPPSQSNSQSKHSGTLYPDWKGQTTRKPIRRRESKDSEKSNRRDSESDVVKAQRDELSKRAESLGNRITKSKFFTKTCQDIFKKMDVDNSGELEKIEVYTGVLVLYTIIIAYVPIATPPPREEVDALFDEADADNSGLLNAQEFQDVATILCCEVTSRLIKQMLFYLAFLPFLVSILITAFDGFITAPSFIPETVVTVVMKIRQPALVGICGALILPMIASRLFPSRRRHILSKKNKNV